MQIYCDFSGYTDIAIGLALLMGFVFPQNFDRPYRARSVREFWRRWHMTLSRYLRDFLYIPLGGNRGGRLAHGAQPDDHDAPRRPVARRRVGLRAVGRPARRGAGGRARPARPRPAAAGGARVGDDLLFVCLAWIPFRAADLDTAGPSPSGSSPRPGDPVEPRRRRSRCSASSRCSWRPSARSTRCASACKRSTRSRSAPALAVVVALVGASVPGNAVPPFIYFQF